MLRTFFGARASLGRLAVRPLRSSEVSRPSIVGAPASSARHFTVSAAVAADMGDKEAGTVKWFNSTKGFGFITPSSGGSDLFVHQTDIITNGFRSLAEGEAVEFVKEQGGDGRTRAVQVTGPNGAPPQGQPRDQGYGGGGGGGSFGGGGGQYGGGGGGQYGGGQYGQGGGGQYGGQGGGGQYGQGGGYGGQGGGGGYGGGGGRRGGYDQGGYGGGY